MTDIACYFTCIFFSSNKSAMARDSNIFLIKHTPTDSVPNSLVVSTNLQNPICYATYSNWK